MLYINNQELEAELGEQDPSEPKIYFDEGMEVEAWGFVAECTDSWKNTPFLCNIIDSLVRKGIFSIELEDKMIFRLRRDPSLLGNSSIPQAWFYEDGFNMRETRILAALWFALEAEEEHKHSKEVK